MKKILTLISLFFGLTSFSYNAPDYYECTNDTTKLVIQKLEEDYKISLIEEDHTRTNIVTPSSSDLGLTMGIVVKYIPDFMVEKLVITVPHINLLHSTKVTFQAEVKHVTARTSIGGSSLVDGVITSIGETQTVKCVAK